MLTSPVKAPHARAFLFERDGKRVIACWHTCGSATLDVALDRAESVQLAGIRYIETSLAADAAKKAWAKAIEK